MLLVELCKGVERDDKRHDDREGLIGIDADRALQAAVVRYEVTVFFIDEVAEGSA